MTALSHNPMRDVVQPSASRRSLLVGTPLAAMLALTPHAALGEVQADRELIDACEEIVTLETYVWKTLQERFPSRDEEGLLNEAQEKPKQRQFELIEKVIDTPAATINGIRAKARAAQAWSNGIWDNGDDYDHQFVASLLRDLLAAGGVA